MTTGSAFSRWIFPPIEPRLFEVADSNACPAQPEIQAIALGPEAEFVWYPTIQRVVLKRGPRECPVLDQWPTLFFDTLLETVPVVHSPEGAAQLQAKLRQAQLLEAGIFLDCHQVGMWQTLHRWLGLHPPSTLAPGRRRAPCSLPTRLRHTRSL